MIKLSKSDISSFSKNAVLLLTTRTKGFNFLENKINLWFLAIVLVSYPHYNYGNNLVFSSILEDGFSNTYISSRVATSQDKVSVIGTFLIIPDSVGVCERCPKIVEFEFNSTEENLTIIYGDEKTKNPLSISKFNYDVKYEFWDVNGRLVFTHTSSDTSLILILKQIEDSGVYHLFIRPGRLGIMQYKLLKR